MSAYESGLSDIDPITEARGMDALSKARAMRARVNNTLTDSPTRSQVDGRQAPGGLDSAALFDPEYENATGSNGLEAAVDAAKTRLALDGAANQTEAEVRSARAMLSAHAQLGGSGKSMVANETFASKVADQTTTDAAPAWWFTPVEYTHLWVSADGETHIKECTVSKLEPKGYSGAPQMVRDGLPPPTNVVFTELSADFDNPWHVAPCAQWVVTLRGSWYVKTSDGTRREFGPGDVLFQDNTFNSPCPKQAEHYSGNAGRGPCQQMICQIAWAPQVDNPGPF